MDRRPAVVDEETVGSPGQVRDPSVGAAALAGPIHHGHGIGDLIANKRLGPVVEVGQEDLVRRLAGRHDVAVFVDRLDDGEVIRQVHGVAGVTREGVHAF